MPYVTIKNWPTSGPSPYRPYRVQILMDTANNQYELTVPGGYTWTPISVFAQDLTTDIVSDQRVELRIQDADRNIVFDSGAPNLHSNERHYITWAKGLQPTDYDNGQLPPTHFITQSLIDVSLKPGWIIGTNRETIGGAAGNEWMAYLYYWEEIVK